MPLEQVAACMSFLSLRSTFPGILFKLEFGTQYVGGIYVKSAKGRKLPQSRIVYLDCSAPTKPIMHVAETVEDENRVRSNYSWSWGERVLADNSLFSANSNVHHNEINNT